MQTEDPFDLNRFLTAQASNYSTALAEIRNGKKVSHWIWYIFPQFEGLGNSIYSSLYSIKSVGEARQYLAHPALGARLYECTELLLEVEGRSALQVFGETDEKKVRSCMTLFALVTESGSIFSKALDKYYAGKQDERTLYLVEESKSL